MKKSELIERVQKKIDELGTLFTEKAYAPNGALLGKIHYYETARGVRIFFANGGRNIGTNNRNPEKVVEEFYNDNKF